ncbi:MAG TPA: hypothetical protein VJ885_01380 [Thermoanaerobaculia bacterium]|nr:hypothetical protein [Thermoanaerobaculia bacterium]
MKRTRPSAFALLLTLVLLLGALPAAAAGHGPSAGLSLNWEDVWSRFIALLLIPFDDTSPMIDPDGRPRGTSNPGTGSETSPMIDPNGAQSETSPGIDPLG